MVRPLLAVVAAVLLLPAAARADPPAGFAETTAYSVPGEYLTSVRFAPDGHVFAAGKGGLVYEFDGPGDSTPAVFADLRLQTFDGWDRGITGLAVDPDYLRGRPYVYVAYTVDRAPGSDLVPAWSDTCPLLPAGCPAEGRVSRLAPDGAETVLLDDFCDQSLSHSMGTLAFGPDGDLYVSAGDGASYSSVDYGQDANPCGDPPAAAGTSLAPPDALGGAMRAQSYRRPAALPASLDGAILRIDPDSGAAAAGNPDGSDAVRRRIVAYGFRNPFRMTFRPGTGELWAGDVGFATWEEIDRVPDVSRVRNYGWPCFEGGVVQDGYAAAGLDACRALGQAATEAPYFTYRHGDALAGCPAGSSSISGLVFYDAAAFPARYRGALFFADYSRDCIWAMLPGADGLPDPQRVETFEAGAAMPVDLQVGPDGALYYADVFGGTIQRIAPVGDAPVARIDVSHAGSTYSFDGSRSSGMALTYAWDLDGDGAYDDATGAHVSRDYVKHGYVNVGLQTTDARGSSGVATTRLTIGTPPAVTIAPGGDGWAVGQEIAFAGSARDESGAALPAAALHWTLDLRHCSALAPDSCHTHRIQDFAGVAAGHFAAPDHEFPSHLELTLTATDANGLSASQTVRLDPRTVDVTVHSEPEGLRVAFGGEAQATPFTRAVIAKSQTTMSAASPQSLGGASYVFGYWSDGGAATHALSAPAPTSVTATYGRPPELVFAGSDAVNAGAFSRAFPGHGEVYAMTAARTGPVLALRLHLDPTSEAARMILGVYADIAGEAGALLASAPVEHPVAGAWNEARLAQPLPLTAGTSYWFALLDPADSGGILRWNDRASATPGSERTSRDADLAALPANWFVGQKYDAGPVSGVAIGPDPAFVVSRPVAVATPAPAPGPQAPLPVTPAPAAPVRLALPAQSLRLRGGKVPVRLACPARAAQSCRLTVELLRGERRLGRAAATVRPGAARTVHIRLARRDRRRQTVTIRVTWGGQVVRRQAVISAPRSRSTSAA